jgi:hypothetical protein
MQRTGPAQPPYVWEITYWRSDPYPHWEPIMECPHSRVAVGMVQRLCDKQPNVQFRLRLNVIEPLSIQDRCSSFVAIPGE